MCWDQKAPYGADYYSTNGSWSTFQKDPSVGAWLVTSAPVPLPGALWLLSSGLIGIVGVKRRFKK